MPSFLSAGLGYLFGDGKEVDPRHPRLLYGVRSLVESALKACHSATPYTHFTLSHAPEDNPSDRQLVSDVCSIIRMLLPGIPLVELAFVIVRHCEQLGTEVGDAAAARAKESRTCAHVFLVNAHLPSGKRLQPYYAPAHGQRLWELSREQNQAQGYASPDELWRRENRKIRCSYDEYQQAGAIALDATVEIIRDIKGLPSQEWAAELRAVFPDSRIQVIDRSGGTERHAKIHYQNRIIRITYNQSRNEAELHLNSRRKPDGPSCETRRGAEPENRPRDGQAHDPAFQVDSRTNGNRHTKGGRHQQRAETSTDAHAHEREYRRRFPGPAANYSVHFEHCVRNSSLAVGLGGQRGHQASKPDTGTEAGSQKASSSIGSSGIGSPEVNRRSKRQDREFAEKPGRGGASGQDWSGLSGVHRGLRDDTAASEADATRAVDGKQALPYGKHQDRAHGAKPTMAGAENREHREEALRFRETFGLYRGALDAAHTPGAAGVARTSDSYQSAVTSAVREALATLRTEKSIEPDEMDTPSIY